MQLIDREREGGRETVLSRSNRLSLCVRTSTSVFVVERSPASTSRTSAKNSTPRPVFEAGRVDKMVRSARFCRRKAGLQLSAWGLIIYANSRLCVCISNCAIMLASGQPSHACANQLCKQQPYCKLATQTFSNCSKHAVRGNVHSARNTVIKNFLIVKSRLIITLLSSAINFTQSQ